jgi:hypothetical protein
MRLWITFKGDFVPNKNEIKWVTPVFARRSDHSQDVDRCTLGNSTLLAAGESPALRACTPRAKLSALPIRISH